VLTSVFIGGLIGIAISSAWAATFAFAHLALRWHIRPVCLMRFLEDARERQVLRAVGPAYQFRHARLQDRLAEEKTLRDRQAEAIDTRPHTPI
jgi:hypothetical protein